MLNFAPSVLTLPTRLLEVLTMPLKLAKSATVNAPLPPPHWLDCTITLSVVAYL